MPDNEPLNLGVVLGEMPDTILADSMKPLLAKWANPPTALQVLEVLDHCIFGALATTLVITVLQTEYDNRLHAEGTTHEEILKFATWRELGKM